MLDFFVTELPRDNKVTAILRVAKSKALPDFSDRSPVALYLLKELPENCKNKGITLTEKGRQLCEEVIAPLLRQEEQTMAAIGETESRELIRLLELYGKAYREQIEYLINLRVFTEKD